MKHNFFENNEKHLIFFVWFLLIFCVIPFRLLGILCRECWFVCNSKIYKSRRNDDKPTFDPFSLDEFLFISPKFLQYSIHVLSLTGAGQTSCFNKIFTLIAKTLKSINWILTKLNFSMLIMITWNSMILLFSSMTSVRQLIKEIMIFLYLLSDLKNGFYIK